jgi:hypothetical protein
MLDDNSVALTFETVCTVSLGVLCTSAVSCRFDDEFQF